MGLKLLKWNTTSLTPDMHGIPYRAFIWEFILFGIKEARACIFAGMHT